MCHIYIYSVFEILYYNLTNNTIKRKIHSDQSLSVYQSKMQLKHDSNKWDICSISIMKKSTPHLDYISYDLKSFKQNWQKEVRNH